VFGSKSAKKSVKEQKFCTFSLSLSIGSKQPLYLYILAARHTSHCASVRGLHYTACQSIWVWRVYVYVFTCGRCCQEYMRIQRATHTSLSIGIGSHCEYATHPAVKNFSHLKTPRQHAHCTRKATGRCTQVYADDPDCLAVASTAGSTVLVDRSVGRRNPGVWSPISIDQSAGQTTARSASITLLSPSLGHTRVDSGPCGTVDLSLDWSLMAPTATATIDPRTSASCQLAKPSVLPRGSAWRLLLPRPECCSRL
jgi:hypothetical protein